MVWVNTIILEVVSLRIKINLKKENMKLPLNYQFVLQGLIYNAFSKGELGDFYHNEGYNFNNKKFKMFVFSNIFGDYTIKDKDIEFKDFFSFYISSQDEIFLKTIYNYFVYNRKIVIFNQVVDVISIEIKELPHFNGVKDVKIVSLSPVTAYRTEGKFVTYFSPDNSEFEKLLIQNLKEKNIAINNLISNIEFSIINVDKSKKRLVRFKNTFYETYMVEILIKVNYETLLLIYNTGLSAKGSCGFGMIDILL